MCRDAQGNIVSDRNEVLDRWADYYSELYNPPHRYENDQDNSLINLEEVDQIDEPSVEEVKSAISKLHNNKATGTDKLPSELLKGGGEQLAIFLHDIIIDIWRKGMLPNQWNEGIIHSIHKKGDQLACSNYRGITLLNTAYKVFSNILYNRLTPYAERELGAYQCGFRSNRSTTDHIFAIRQIIEKATEYNMGTHMIFIDFKKAYDTILRNQLYKALAALGIPTHLINMTRATMHEVKCQVKIENNLSKSFGTTNGLRQGDALSCLLFNLTLEYIIRKSGIGTKGCIFSKPVQLLAYADDLVIISRTLESLKQAFLDLEKTAKEMGLCINEEKTKYMKIKNLNGIPMDSASLKIGNYNIGVVKEFIYLGSLIRYDSDTSYEIKRRIMLANRAYYGLRSQLNSHVISRNTKFKLYNSLIKPVLLYGSEAWVMKTQDKNILDLFERKVLRTICGGVLEHDLWRRRYNFELYNIYKQPSASKSVKLSRLRWIGHVERYRDTVQTKMVYLQKPLGKRTAGRPRKRYIDDVEEDIKKIRKRNWREIAKNREYWKELLKEAKAHPGL